MNYGILSDFCLYIVDHQYFV